MPETRSPEFMALKDQLKATWTTGDYGRVAEGLTGGAEVFFSRLPVERGTRLLDVACGSGQIAIPAARAGARVTGVDIAENWIEQARERAAGEDLDIRFDVGDAEDLPFDDASFDVTVSLIGAMFAPRPERVAAELLRVTRPGGNVIMGNWTSESFVGEFFRTVGRHAPPPEMPSPLLWGDEATVRERFGDNVSDLRLTRLPYEFHHDDSPAAVVDFYCEHFGPVKQALASLNTDQGTALRKDLLELWLRHNQAEDGTTRVIGEILEVVAITKLNASP